MRILSLGILHETNTFCVSPTTLADFRRASPMAEFRDGASDSGSGGGGGSGSGGGAEVMAHFRGTRTVLGGALAEAERRGDVLECLFWAFPSPGGTVEQSAYVYMKEMALERLRAAGPCDGVLLDLHGAMVTSALEDAEGDLIEAVRGVVGAKVPIVVVLDLHANLTARMVRFSDLIIGYDLYPHTDMYERGVEAAAALSDIFAGRIKPVMAFRPLPLITMPTNQCTLREPMRSMLQQAHAVEAEAGVVNVTLISGFSMADIHDAGMSVVVTTNGDRALAEAKAEALSRAIWDQRAAFTPKLTPVAEALQYAQTARGLVVLADGSDNPGAGGTCDTAELLTALLNAKVADAVVNCIWDPAVVQAACKAGVGATIDVAVGGKADVRFGPPAQMRARVKVLSDGAYIRRGAMGAGEVASFGRSAVLVQGGVQVIVTERREQPYDAAFPRSLGIEPTAHRIMVVKSIAHFRSTYQEIAEKIFDMDTQGACRPDFSLYPYKRLRAGMYPVDPAARWV